MPRSDQMCESSRLSMAASERWRLPSLPSRLSSETRPTFRFVAGGRTIN
jgi:hypothetical protein